MFTQTVPHFPRILMYSAPFSWVYVLALAGGKYYVGSTTRSVQERFEEHIRGWGGSAWTRLHRPLRVVEERAVAEGASAAAEEDTVTREYMRRFGVHNVRGGTHAQVELDAGVVETLERELVHAEGRCLRCGGAGHFASACTGRRRPQQPKRGCERCGRASHVAAACYARTDVTGNVLYSDNEIGSDDDDDDDDGFYESE